VLKDSQTSAKISALMTQALFTLKDLVDNDAEYEMDYYQVVTVFLQGVISTAIDLAELHSPGVSPMIYADIESSSKLGGLRAIANMQSENGSISYSVSDINAGDPAMAMNYLGQQMWFCRIYKIEYALNSKTQILDTMRPSTF
jgi:hypothetical protein